MAATSIAEILKCAGMRLTPARKEIYRIFLENERTLSHGDLEKITAGNFDRVTIYRTLDLFLENNLIHKVPDDSGAARYAAGSGSEQQTGEIARHLHFKCQECGKSYCLKNVNIPEFKFPKNIFIKRINISVEGKCADCRSSE